RSSASRRYSHRSLNNAIQCQAALSRSDTRDLPTAKERFTNTSAREARMERGHFVNITCHKHVWTIQTRDRTLQLEIRANLREVDRVSIVSGVSKILREGVSELRS